jgi:hypothetical protein
MGESLCPASSLPLLCVCAARGPAALLPVRRAGWQGAHPSGVAWLARQARPAWRARLGRTDPLYKWRFQFAVSG